jgi:hypothetical protein
MTVASGAVMTVASGAVPIASGLVLDVFGVVVEVSFRIEVLRKTA